jgi:hypothetical protein
VSRAVSGDVDTEGDATTVHALDDRDVRALTERMAVLPDDGDGLHTVVGQNGGTYTVDARKGRCTCPDAKHNLPTDDGREWCKHAARVAYATGARPVPAWADTDAVDAMLGEHVDATPQVAATDGGILEPGDDGVVLDDEGGGDDARPDECDCGAWNADAELPCWPCYRDGFDTPASAE